MPDQITVLHFPEFREIVGPHCNPHLTIAVARGDTPGDLHFTVGELANGVAHDRVLSTIDYIRHLYRSRTNRNAPTGSFLFQAEDVPADAPSVSWEARREWTDLTLVPDLYYFTAQGYETWSPRTVPWRARKAQAVWRGSTTGLFYFSVDDLDRLPRYRLCKTLSGLGDAADVALTGVVQTADSAQEQLVRTRLEREGLFKPFLPMEEMSQFRYVLDIDGNSNSWNFMMKLRLGACVLRVDSDWEQWFCDRLRPWYHYVPIAKDLSDAADVLRWCLDNSGECEAIAARGKAFASEMRFTEEMTSAANKIFLPVA